MGSGGLTALCERHGLRHRDQAAHGHDEEVGADTLRLLRHVESDESGENRVRVEARLDGHSRTDLLTKIAAVILVAVGLVSGTITLLNERSSYNLVMKGITARATLGTNSLAESLGAPTKFGKFDLVEAAIAAIA